MLLSRQLLHRLPRLVTIHVRTLKRMKPSKVDEIDAAQGKPPGETAAPGQDPPPQRARVKIDKNDKLNIPGCSVKYHREPHEMVPEFSSLVTQHPDLYSRVENLSNLQDEDVGKFINIEGYVPSIPESLQSTLADPFLMAGKFLMLRQTMFDIFMVLNEIDGDATPSAKGSSIGVHGQRGGGKTVLLNMLAVYALQNPRDWLLLATNGEEFMKDLHGAVSPSKTRPGIFNQSRNSREWLRNLMKREPEKLKKVKLQGSYNYPWLNVELLNSGEVLIGDQARQGAKPPETLYDLCEQALYDLGFSADVFYDVIEEIRITKEFKTLVLIDNINVWDQASEFRDPANPFKRIPARNLSMVDAFQQFQRVGPDNGLSVFCMTSHATLNMGKAHMEQAKYTMEQKIYSNPELKSAYLHYKASRMLKSDVTSFLLARVKGLTGCVPRDAFFDAALI